MEEKEVGEDGDGCEEEKLRRKKRRMVRMVTMEGLNFVGFDDVDEDFDDIVLKL